MTTSKRSPARHDVCAVCGAEARTDAVEDTNGWRWFNDGEGGLVPLCADCPVPTDYLNDVPPISAMPPVRRWQSWVGARPPARTRTRGS
jgi:hypothetical protein